MLRMPGWLEASLIYTERRAITPLPSRSPVPHSQEERIYPAFKKTPSYLKLLAELDLLKDPTGDDDDSQSTGSGGDTASICSGDLPPDDPGDLASTADPPPPPPPRDLSKVWRIVTEVAVSAAARDSARSYTVYSVTATVMARDKRQDTWTVPRRYSDFHDFHEKVLERVSAVTGERKGEE